jgi:thymidylate synthase (FAD)
MKKGHTVNVLDGNGFVRYIDHLGSDQRICEAARLSYKAPSKGAEQDKKLITYLWKNRHTSPFEMAKITFNIKMPIFVMRQYVRHRMQNLNEVSARYTELPNEFYIPNEWRKQDTKNKQGSIEDSSFNPIWSIPDAAGGDITTTMIVKNYCKNSYDLYKQMLEKGIAREMARMVLPINIYTEIYSTWDLNNLLKFIVLRDDKHAQTEMQEYAKVMKDIAKELFPFTLEAYEKHKFVVKEQDQ